MTQLNRYENNASIAWKWIHLLNEKVNGTTDGLPGHLILMIRNGQKRSLRQAMFFLTTLVERNPAKYKSMI